MNEPFFAVAFFLFGLVFGSFLNVCIHRLPLGRSVVKPGSTCPNCGKPVRWYDNVPVVGWLVLRGRCRDCSHPIRFRYVAIELLTGMLFLGSYLAFGPTVEAAKYCAFSFLLLGLIATDAEHHLLPDALTLPGFWLGVALSLVVYVGGPTARLLPDSMPFDSELTLRAASLMNALIGAAVGAGFIWLVGRAYLAARGVEGMGFGDVKLMAMVGAFLGAAPTVLVLFLASLVGSLAGLFAMLLVWFKRRGRYGRARRADAASRAWQGARVLYRRFEIPFGVFLGSAALLAAYFGQPVIDWYAGLYR